MSKLYAKIFLKKTGNLHNYFLCGDLIGSESLSTKRVNFKPLPLPFFTIYLYIYQVL